MYVCMLVTFSFSKIYVYIYMEVTFSFSEVRIYIYICMYRISLNIGPGVYFLPASFDPVSEV